MEMMLSKCASAHITNKKESSTVRSKNEIDCYYCYYFETKLCIENYTHTHTHAHARAQRSMTWLINDMAFIFKCTTEWRRDMQPDMKNGKWKMFMLQILIGFYYLVDGKIICRTFNSFSHKFCWTSNSRSLRAHTLDQQLWQINIFSHNRTRTTHNKNNNFLSSNLILFFSVLLLRTHTHAL